MEVTEVKEKYNKLSAELRIELGRMERTERVLAIRDEIKNLQRLCPHNADFAQTSKCPYCGKRYKE